MHRFGMVLEDLGDVVRAGCGMLPQPQEIEQTDVAVRSRFRDLAIMRQGAAEIVGGGEIAEIVGARLCSGRAIDWFLGGGQTFDGGGGGGGEIGRASCRESGGVQVAGG